MLCQGPECCWQECCVTKNAEVNNLWSKQWTWRLQNSQSNNTPDGPTISNCFNAALKIILQYFIIIINKWHRQKLEGKKSSIKNNKLIGVIYWKDLAEWFLSTMNKTGKTFSGFLHEFERDKCNQCLNYCNSLSVCDVLRTVWLARPEFIEVPRRKIDWSSLISNRNSDTVQSQETQDRRDSQDNTPTFISVNLDQEQQIASTLRTVIKYFFHLCRLRHYNPISSLKSK